MIPPACRTHIIAVTRNEERIVGCGIPTQLPPGAYAAWLEWPGRVSLFPELFDGAGNGEHRLPVTAAGGVCLDPSSEAAAYELWHMESHISKGALAPSFHRKTTKPGAVLQLPTGRAIAVSLSEHGEVTAVSPPLEVAESVEIASSMSVSSEGATLCAFLTRPGDVPAVPGDVRLFASDRGETREPDAFLNSGDSVVALWYRMPAGRTEITMQSERMRLPAETMILRSGQIATLRSSIRRLPTLSVAINFEDDRAGKQRLSLAVAQQNGINVRLMDTVHPGVMAIESLPAAPLSVELKLGHWAFVKEVDLSSGVDASVQFELRPIVIRGRVSYGNVAAPARVDFLATEPVSAESDDDGRYQIALWQPGRYTFRVRLRDHPDVSPFLDTIRVTTSQDLDIAIPKAPYALRVTDSSTSEGVANAKVTITNDWQDPIEGARRVMSHVVTGSDGHAGLPPLRDGTLELRVDAEGYEAGSLARQPVSSAADPVTLEVSLKPLASPVRLTILLPDGSAAAGAELIAMTPSDQVLYSATADNNGIVRLSSAMQSVLLVVRHPRAAGAVRAWPSLGSTQGDLTWPLAPAASSLTLRASRADGKPAAGIPVYAWISGLRVGGIALAFLGHTQPFTDMDGEWTARNLPPSPLTVLLVGPSRAKDVAAGAFDTVAETIPYPWPPFVAVRVR